MLFRSTIRSLSSAVIVLKRGPMGCVVFPAAIPARLEDGIVGQGFPIEVYNVLGAGDAFLSGFLRGWLRGEEIATCATWANACGAFAVSRLLCAPEIPTWEELQYFLKHGSPYKALRKDEAINHVHWATTRREQPPKLLALAIDHRMQLEAMADKAAAPRADFRFQASGDRGDRQGVGRQARIWHLARRYLRARGDVRRGEARLMGGAAFGKIGRAHV